jgi:hypothetical protein
MVSRVHAMTTCKVCVVARFFVIPGLVVLGRLAMMARRILVMLSALMRCRHDKVPPKDCAGAYQLSPLCFPRRDFTMRARRRSRRTAENLGP